ncbi:MAG: anthranilate phosphoribosyltransferase [Methyloligella sp. ZOD6]
MPSSGPAEDRPAPTDLREAIRKIESGSELTEREATDAFELVMAGHATPAQLGAFLMALKMRGEAVSEITGAAKVLRSKVRKVKAPDGAIDTCGTGGDAKGTHNISTCAAFVVAGAGLPVAKHGNRSISSRSGSADVLIALGVNIDLEPDQVSRCIDETGLGFMFAPAHHSAMRHVAPVRQELGTRTIFNLLGPLANPAETKFQLIGVYGKEWVEPIAHVLGRLGVKRAWVVHGADGLDELTTTTFSYVAALDAGKISTFKVSPKNAGLPEAKPQDLLGGDAAENAAHIRAVLEGMAGPFRDIVLFNAGAALMVGGKAKSLRDGVALAADAIDSGKAKAVLDKLIEISQEGA